MPLGLTLPWETFGKRISRCYVKKNSPIITIPLCFDSLHFVSYLMFCKITQYLKWYIRTWKGIHFCRFSEKPYFMCFIWLEVILKKKSAQKICSWFTLPILRWIANKRPTNWTFSLIFCTLWFISHPVIIRNLATIEYWCHCVLWTASIFTNGNFSNGHDDQLLELLSTPNN